MQNFTITTNSFKNGDILPHEQVLNAHGCCGLNISPDLKWENAPANTAEFALICHDPDAPVQNGWYHWIVLGIPNNVTSFEKGVKITPPIFEAATSFSDIEGYGGACPPVGHGVHHYNFTIYALKTAISKEIKNLKPFEIEKEVEKNSISKATVTAIYQR